MFSCPHESTVEIYTQVTDSPSKCLKSKFIQTCRASYDTRFWIKSTDDKLKVQFENYRIRVWNKWDLRFLIEVESTSISNKIQLLILPFENNTHFWFLLTLNNHIIEFIRRCDYEINYLCILPVVYCPLQYKQIFRFYNLIYLIYYYIVLVFGLFCNIL